MDGIIEAAPMAAPVRPKAQFLARNLSVQCYAQGHTEWHYGAADAFELVAAVTRYGYFDDALDLMATGDTLTISDLATGRGAVRFVERIGGHVILHRGL